jgi:hypothetical protein
MEYLSGRGKLRSIEVERRILLKGLLINSASIFGISLSDFGYSLVTSSF